MRGRTLALPLVALCAMGSAVPGTAAHSTVPADPPADCTTVQVPVTVPAVDDATISGQYCVPASGATTVQLLVHGGTYNHAYWAWPAREGHYSYAQRALRAGYATFAVDRLGVGRSTRPLSTLVTFAAGAEAMHDVVGALRAGTVGGQAFDRVVWVGHSLGSFLAWQEASMYSDVDAFVLTAALHRVRPVFLAVALGSIYPANLDPAFADAGLDPGYLTTVPGTRGELFYLPRTSDPDVIALDEQLKDTTSLTEFAGAIAALEAPPELAPSRAIGVPTLVVVGQDDLAFCGGPDPLDCTAEQVTKAEASFYAPRARLRVEMVPDTGHNLQLHHTADVADAAIRTWLAATL